MYLTLITTQLSTACPFAAFAFGNQTKKYGTRCHYW